jgi:hypothetical protein
MATPEGVLFDVDQLLRLFPGDALLITRLLVQDDAFRNVCEDLLLAKRTLTRLENFQEEQQLAKISEYRELVVELNNEVAKVLEHARRPA